MLFQRSVSKCHRSAKPGNWYKQLETYGEPSSLTAKGSVEVKMVAGGILMFGQRDWSSGSLRTS